MISRDRVQGAEGGARFTTSSNWAALAVPSYRGGAPLQADTEIIDRLFHVVKRAPPSARWTLSRERSHTVYENFFKEFFFLDFYVPIPLLIGYTCTMAKEKKVPSSHQKINLWSCRRTLVNRRSPWKSYLYCCKIVILSQICSNSLPARQGKAYSYSLYTHKCMSTVSAISKHFAIAVLVRDLL